MPGCEGYLLACDASQVTIGRQACDLNLDDRSVSRRHASLTVIEGNVMLEDLGSKYGCRVNGQSVKGRRLVKPGDELQFGAMGQAFRLERVSLVACVAETDGCRLRELRTELGAHLGIEFTPTWNAECNVLLDFMMQGDLRSRNDHCLWHALAQGKPILPGEEILKHWRSRHFPCLEQLESPRWRLVRSQPLFRQVFAGQLLYSASGNNPLAEIIFNYGGGRVTAVHDTPDSLQLGIDVRVEELEEAFLTSHPLRLRKKSDSERQRVDRKEMDKADGEMINNKENATDNIKRTHSLKEKRTIEMGSVEEDLFLAPESAPPATNNPGQSGHSSHPSKAMRFSIVKDRVERASEPPKMAVLPMEAGSGERVARGKCFVKSQGVPPPPGRIANLTANSPEANAKVDPWLKEATGKRKREIQMEEPRLDAMVVEAPFQSDFFKSLLQ